MINQMDFDDFTMTMMKCIIDHCKDESTDISKDDMYVSVLSRTEEDNINNNRLIALNTLEGCE